MKNKIENEDILIARGAQLAGEKAPVEMDKKRAAKFVRQSLKPERSSIMEKLFGSYPMAVRTIAGGLAIAAVAAFFIVLQGPGVIKGTINEMESVHSAIDTVTTSPDSTALENVEIISINE